MAKVLGLVTFRIYPPEMGGQKGVASFYEHLEKYYEVILAVSADNRINNKNVYPVLFSNRAILKNSIRLGVLRSLVRKHKPSVIIAEHSYPAWIAWLIATSFTIPFIIHSHNIEAARFQKMKRRWWKAYWHYEKWIHRKANHSFFISQEDMEFAIRNMQLDPECCSVVTYGISNKSLPEQKTDRENIFLFNGSLDYSPNKEAVWVLADVINPILRTKLNDYKIVITGKGADRTLIEKINETPEMEFLGYVPDLSALFAQASAVINPVVNNTGIKTKVVEAIGSHCTVVSTESGATGVKKDLCGNKLKVVPDDNWPAFADAMVTCSKEQWKRTPEAYFSFYTWENIAAKAAADIESTIQRHEPAHIPDRI